jgi:uncharacterized membrane protein
MGTDRLEAFSDGVIAIIITIMVLEMKVPEGESLRTLTPLLHVFLSYVLSFVYLGIYWNNHHHMMHVTSRVNGAILWANLHLLFWLSLVPFVTGWMGENRFAPAPTALYGGVMLMAAIAYWILLRAILRAEGPGSVLARAVGRDIKGKISPVLYLIAIPLAFVEEAVAGAIYVAVALMWLVPDRRIERVLGSGAGAASLVAGALLACFNPATLEAQSPPPCAQHARDCPAPPVINAGPPGAPAPPPSDAVILFDGRSLAAWRSSDGSPARWLVRSGYMQVAAGTGGIRTVREFGDVQLHIEWASPSPARGEDQDRGNSGVFLMGQYEVQVLDSYGNHTYPDGQAAAVYGQYPPLVNASRAPGQWQSYDIVFRRPRFAEDGSLRRPATLTVFHNGVLVQDGVTLTGPTAHQSRPGYTRHPDKLPISLQDHAHPVRFRNIWLRELER